MIVITGLACLSVDTASVVGVSDSHTPEMMSGLFVHSPPPPPPQRVCVIGLAVKSNQGLGGGEDKDCAAKELHSHERLCCSRVWTGSRTFDGCAIKEERSAFLALSARNSTAAYFARSEDAIYDH